MTKRCAWARTDLSIAYHDREWGVPAHDDRLLFEFLILEGAQAGLSWETILRKRENYRAAFDNFDPRKVAKYNDKKVERLLQNEGIIRNRLKIAAAIQNAKAFLTVQQEFGSFAEYLWSFVNHKPQVRKRGARSRLTRHFPMRSAKIFAPRFQVCRHNHLLLVHASDRFNQRPRLLVFSLSTGKPIAGDHLFEPLAWTGCAAERSLVPLPRDPG